jgi:hypothetical protein
MEIKKCPVMIVDRPCGLQLFHVSTEEPTSGTPPLELWECARGHRMHFVSKKEESKSNAEDWSRLRGPIKPSVRDLTNRVFVNLFCPVSYG